MVSSFSTPHRMYLFDMKNGRKKLAYGQDPADALEILGMRLPPEEMAGILPDQYIRIRQQDVQKYIHDLG